jgi:signal transduction histidine kinase
MAQVLLISAVSVFIYNYYPSQQKKTALRAIESEIRSISNMFSIGVGIGMGDTDLVAVSEALNWAHSNKSVVYISVVDGSGQEIAYFEEDGFQPGSAPASIDENKTVEVNRMVNFKTPILYQNLPFGTLTIGYSLKKLDADIAKLKLTTLYFCLALFTTGVVISIVIGNMITQGIRRLDATVKAISSGNENVRVEVTSQDEIGKLGRAFNHMLHRLDKSRNELVKYSRQLEKQNEELNQFSYVVSHDLKAPLRAIFKLSEWIEEDLGDSMSGESKTNMQTLRRRVFRLEALINGLLQYSKIGRINAPVEKVNVRAMIREAIDLLNPPSHFRICVQEGMPVFLTQKIMLQQVIMNLLSNAIKYNDKLEGQITVGVKDKDLFYEFFVEDNGMGIDPLYHEKVFGIFQTLEARDKVEGTGVGLSITKKCIEDVGGIIKVESQNGCGAKFSFTWPKQENSN